MLRQSGFHYCVQYVNFFRKCEGSMENSIYCTRTTTPENLSTKSEIRFWTPQYIETNLPKYWPSSTKCKRRRVNPCEAWIPVRGDRQSDNRHGAPSVPRCRVSQAPPLPVAPNPILIPSWSSQGPIPEFWVVSAMELTDIRKHLL